jgi:hypothetical protein
LKRGRSADDEFLKFAELKHFAAERRWRVDRETLHDL